VRPTTLRTGGVQVHRAKRTAPPIHPEGATVARGDYLIEGERLRVLVGGMTRGRASRGAVLDVALRERPSDEGIVLLAPQVHVGQRAHRIEPQRMYVVSRRGRATLRIEGKVRAGKRRLRVARELTLGGEPGGAIPWLSTTTRVSLGARKGAGLDDVRIGARIGWGGAPPFVPGVGTLDDDAWHEANWVGRPGEHASTVFGYHAAPLQLRARYDRHGPQRFLAHTTIGAPKCDLRAQADCTARGTLAFVPGGLSEPVRRLGWARGDPFPEVLVTLPYAPTGSTVTASTSGGAPVVEGQPDAGGQVLMPLPPVRADGDRRAYRLVATAYGHAPSDPAIVEGRRERVRLVIPRGGRARISVTDGQGQAMPGRARIVGLGGTDTPKLGPDWRAEGAGPAVVTVEGDVVVPLPPGRYRVLVSHGPEWSVGEYVIEVTETYRPHVKAQLEHVVDAGPWVSGDFHLHAAPSKDSEVSLEDRIATLAAEGVDFAVPTDHNHVTDYRPVLEQMGLQSSISSVPGVEITTWDPQFGHFNAYPYPIDEDDKGNGAPEYQRTSPKELFARLRRIDPKMIIQVSHPRLEPKIGYFDLMGLDAKTGAASDRYSTNYDVLEVFNGFDIARPEHVDRVFQDWLHILARGRRVIANGSSDSHLVRYQWAGYPRTYIRAPTGGASEVIEGLRAGHAFVTSGPFLELNVEGQGPGEQVEATDGAIEARVRVRAPAWMDVQKVELFVGAEKVRTLEVDVRPPAPPEPEKGKTEAAGTQTGPGTRERRSRGPEGVPQAPPPARQLPGDDVPVVRLERTVELDVGGDTFVVARARSDRAHDAFFGREGVYPLAFTNPVWIDGNGDGRVPWERAPQKRATDAAAEGEEPSSSGADGGADAGRSPTDYPSAGDGGTMRAP
jgi:hypothetical protein